MTFENHKTDDFESLFKKVKPLISNFEGVEHLELLKDLNQPNVYFTLSIWTSETHLENYRHSELFKDTWTKTKAMFAQKAEAWSLGLQ